MKVILLGAAGFIGTNLAIKLSENNENIITLVDKRQEYFKPLLDKGLSNFNIVESELDLEVDYEALLKGQEVVYHLVSTVIPSTSNQQISTELSTDIVMTTKILDASVKCGVKKVIFISSGGTVYGKELSCPLVEDTPTNPITTYGVQKLLIEKLLYLYNYVHGLDYRVIRLANPYGPYQRPNGVLGAVTTFIYRALRNDEITVYGDGSVVRDFIYIDDAVRAITTIAENECEHKLFNLGCGYGTSIRELLDSIEKTLNIKLNVAYKEGRPVDVPVNYLDISRYEECFGALKPISLSEGIIKTADFMKTNYDI